MISSLDDTSVVSGTVNTESDVTGLCKRMWHAPARVGAPIVMLYVCYYHHDYRFSSTATPC